MKCIQMATGWTPWTTPPRAHTSHDQSREVLGARCPWLLLWIPYSSLRDLHNPQTIRLTDLVGPYVTRDLKTSCCKAVSSINCCQLSNGLDRHPFLLTPPRGQVSYTHNSLCSSSCHPDLVCCARNEYIRGAHHTHTIFQCPTQ